jgi:GNAT superfamily N-acetyltransferase
MAIGVVDGETAHVVYTGVDPAYRGRQLARVVKQHLHRELYDRGGRRCVTDNEENNTGIRHVNELLGYRRTMGVYVVRKRLG